MKKEQLESKEKIFYSVSLFSTATNLLITLKRDILDTQVFLWGGWGS